MDGSPKQLGGKAKLPIFVENSVRYLMEPLETTRAKECVQKGPFQIQTDARTLIRAKLGQSDEELPDIFFEDAEHKVSDESQTR